MTSKDHEKIYDPLMEGTDVPADGDFSLEEILAEYGTSREQKILQDVERTISAESQEQTPVEPEVETPAPDAEVQEVPAADEVPPEPPEEKAPRRSHKRILFPGTYRRHAAPPEPEEPEEEPEPPEEISLEEALPRSPHPISLEEVVGSTVDAVMEEERREPLIRPRLGLFSRRKLEETEQIPQPPEEPRSRRNRRSRSLRRCRRPAAGRGRATAARCPRPLPGRWCPS